MIMNKEVGGEGFKIKSGRFSHQKEKRKQNVNNLELKNENVELLNRHQVVSEIVKMREKVKENLAEEQEKDHELGEFQEFQDRRQQEVEQKYR